MLSLPWLFCAPGRVVWWTWSAQARAGTDTDTDQGWPMPIVSRVTMTTMSRVAVTAMSRVASTPASSLVQNSGLGPTAQQPEGAKLVLTVNRRRTKAAWSACVFVLL